jgi:hypothetical protein
MSMDTRRRTFAAETITQAWPGQLGEQVVAAVSEYDAFGALAYRLDQARRHDLDPVQLLSSIDVTTLEWALQDARDPAAFLASRIPTHHHHDEKDEQDGQDEGERDRDGEQL